MSTDPGVRNDWAFELVNTDASGRELAEGDRIAQRSRRSQRGIRIGDARGDYRGGFFRGWPVLLLCMVSFLSSARCAEPLAPAEVSSGDKALAAITGNPAAENQLPGTGLAGRLIHLPEDSGLRLGGLWLADTNGLLSGGAQPGKWSWNSALIIGANLDAEKLLNWKGASFGVQFLQFNGQNTNGQAGSVQGYNSLPGAKPLNRSELYQLWYRQTLFDDKIIFRIGKMLPTYDFNNVARPVPTQDQTLEIPAVTGLLYTPVFVNPTLLGAIGGYYNSVSGLTVTVAPTRNSYLNYGLYDGNVALGVQTGLTGPHFNGYYFNILEAGVDWVVAERYPGEFGAGGWYQTGVLHGSPGVLQNGTGGFYLFGGQRIWGRSTGSPSPDGKNAVPAAEGQKASISTFVQFGLNNSETLPVKEYFGLGFTGFGLVPHRPDDSLGVGMAWSWLNPSPFGRSNELMFQGYYQTHLYAGTFFQPALSYIPNPGVNTKFDGAWALTFRFTLLF
jgi:porin